MPHSDSPVNDIVRVPALRELDADHTTLFSNVNALVPVFRRARLIGENSSRVAAAGLTALALRVLYCQGVQPDRPDASKDRSLLGELEALIVVDAEESNESNVDNLYLSAPRRFFTEPAGESRSTDSIHHTLHVSLLPALRPKTHDFVRLTSEIGPLSSLHSETFSYPAESPSSVLLKALRDYLALHPSAQAPPTQTTFRLLLTLRVAMQGAALARTSTGSQSVRYRHLEITLPDWELTVASMLAPHEYDELREELLERRDLFTLADATFAAKEEIRAMRDGATEETVRGIPSLGSLTRMYIHAFHDAKRLLEIPYLRDSSTSSFASSSLAGAAGSASSQPYTPSYGVFSSAAHERSFSPSALSTSSRRNSSISRGPRRSSPPSYGAGSGTDQRPSRQTTSTSFASSAWSTGYPRRSRSPSYAASSASSSRDPHDHSASSSAGSAGEEEEHEASLSKRCTPHARRERGGAAGIWSSARRGGY
ncbi:hypothetical protein JCM6882_001277 [Rhodosporidiobolus microsporus]